MADLLTYGFGTGDGPVHRHTSAADLDLPGGRVEGRPDAVALDFDGDGRVDDALWDTDGDGAANRSVLDLDDDGHPERAFTDPSGRGLWDGRDPPPPAVAADGGRTLTWSDVRGRSASATAEADTDGDGRADAAVVEADHEAGPELVCDLDRDGRAEQLLVDADGDGRYEHAYSSSAGPGSSAARWDVLLADTDGDGAVDAVIADGAAGWVPP